MPKAIILLICLFFIATSNAFGHRLNVFAWLEKDSIIVRCNFGSKRPALNADVNVLEGANHELLVHGTTNELGEFAFPLPAHIKSGLIIEVNAGQGHKSEWTMAASELSSAAQLAEPQASRVSVQAAPAAKPAPVALTEEELKAILSESLAPLRHQLAELHSNGPGISEIIGGIGWIMGLAGITFYFMGRKNH